VLSHQQCDNTATGTGASTGASTGIVIATRAHARRAAMARLKASDTTKCPPRGVLKVQRLSPRGRKGVPKTGSLRQISHGAWTAAGMTRPERVAAGGASARPPDRGHNVSRASSPGPASTSRKPPVTVSTPWCVHITSCMHTGGGGMAAWPGAAGGMRTGARARGHERLQHVGALHATLPAEQDQ